MVSCGTKLELDILNEINSLEVKKASSPVDIATNVGSVR